MAGMRQSSGLRVQWGAATSPARSSARRATDAAVSLTASVRARVTARVTALRRAVVGACWVVLAACGDGTGPSGTYELTVETIPTTVQAIRDAGSLLVAFTNHGSNDVTLTEDAACGLMSPTLDRLVSFTWQPVATSLVYCVDSRLVAGSPGRIVALPPPVVSPGGTVRGVINWTDPSPGMYRLRLGTSVGTILSAAFRVR